MSDTPKTSELQRSFSQFREGDLARLWDLCRELERENTALRDCCRGCREGIRQIVDLANVNDETRRMLVHVGNTLNDAALKGAP